MASRDAAQQMVVPGTGIDPAFAIGQERRLHARAYARWKDLAGDRSMPLFDEVMAEGFGALAGNSVVIAFGPGGRSPTIAFLGGVLRSQAEHAALGVTCAEVPAGSLLGRLLARLPVIVAGRAAIGFEAEGVSAHGADLLHRGILLPLAAADGSLCAVHGVISWKEAAATAPVEPAVVEAAVTIRSAPIPPSPWAHAPGAVPTPFPSPDRQVENARTWAALALQPGGAERHFHAALGATYDALIALTQRAASDEPGIAVHDVVDRIFGNGLARADRVPFIGALRHAVRLAVGVGTLAAMLDRYPDGYRGFAAAERRARRAVRAAATWTGVSSAATTALTLVPIGADILARAAPRRAEGYRTGNPAAMRAA